MVVVPADAFVAMDYHLDWICVALTLARGASEDAVHPNDGGITGNQEDVDLLVAYEAQGATHLVLLEAKAETGWTNKQMTSKAARLRALFGDDGERWPGVRVHFSLVSPKKPERLESEAWPGWMTDGDGPRWMGLEVPGGLRRVERCDGGGRASAEGEWFRVLRAR